MADRAAVRELAVQTRMWAAFERGLALAAGRTITRHMRRGADGYEQDGLLGISIALETAGQEWFRVLVPHYTKIGNAFGTRTFGRLGLKSAPGALSFKRLEPGTAFEEFDERLVAWVRGEGLLQAKALSETTMLALRGLIEAGELEGLSAGAIARLIRKNTPAISRTRSVTIARTETHNAATFAGQEAARTTGLPMNKRWLAHLGPRTRDSHAEANDQVAGLDEPYLVGGYPMMRPGDGSMGAPAEEIVQCRCGELHEVAA